MNATHSWEGLGLIAAKEVFLALAVLHLVWNIILWMIHKDNPNDLLNEFIQKMLVISFFWFALASSHIWIDGILGGLRNIGNHMTNSGPLYPSKVMEKGIVFASLVIDAAEHTNIVYNFFGTALSLIVGFAIFATFVRIAIEMVIILIGSKIILTGGLVMLGFAGSKWTQSYAERYVSAVIYFGLKLLFITLIVGLGEVITDSWSGHLKGIEEGQFIETYLSVLGATLVYGYLAVRIPDMAAQMFAGGLFMGFGNPVSSMIGSMKSGARGTMQAYNITKGASQMAAGAGYKIGQGAGQVGGAIGNYSAAKIRQLTGLASKKSNENTQGAGI